MPIAFGQDLDRRLLGRVLATVDLDAEIVSIVELVDVGLVDRGGQLGLVDGGRVLLLGSGTGLGECRGVGERDRDGGCARVEDHVGARPDGAGGVDMGVSRVDDHGDGCRAHCVDRRAGGLGGSLPCRVIASAGAGAFAGARAGAGTLAGTAAGILVGVAALARARRRVEHLVDRLVAVFVRAAAGPLAGTAGAFARLFLVHGILRRVEAALDLVAVGIGLLHRALDRFDDRRGELGNLGDGEVLDLGVGVDGGRSLRLAGDGLGRRLLHRDGLGANVAAGRDVRVARNDRVGFVHRNVDGEEAARLVVGGALLGKRRLPALGQRTRGLCGDHAADVDRGILDLDVRVAHGHIDRKRCGNETGRGSRVLVDGRHGARNQGASRLDDGTAERDVVVHDSGRDGDGQRDGRCVACDVDGAVRNHGDARAGFDGAIDIDAGVAHLDGDEVDLRDGQHAVNLLGLRFERNELARIDDRFLIDCDVAVADEVEAREVEVQIVLPLGDRAHRNRDHEVRVVIEAAQDDVLGVDAECLALGRRDTGIRSLLERGRLGRRLCGVRLVDAVLHVCVRVRHVRLVVEIATDMNLRLLVDHVQLRRVDVVDVLDLKSQRREERVGVVGDDDCDDSVARCRDLVVGEALERLVVDDRAGGVAVLAEFDLLGLLALEVVGVGLDVGEVENQGVVDQRVGVFVLGGLCGLELETILVAGDAVLVLVLVAVDGARQVNAVGAFPTVDLEVVGVVGDALQARVERDDIIAGTARYLDAALDGVAALARLSGDGVVAVAAEDLELGAAALGGLDDDVDRIVARATRERALMADCVFGFALSVGHGDGIVAGAQVYLRDADIGQRDGGTIVAGRSVERERASVGHVDLGARIGREGKLRVDVVLGSAREEQTGNLGRQFLDGEGSRHVRADVPLRQSVTGCVEHAGRADDDGEVLHADRRLEGIARCRAILVLLHDFGLDEDGALVGAVLHDDGDAALLVARLVVRLLEGRVHSELDGVVGVRVVVQDAVAVLLDVAAARRHLGRRGVGCRRRGARTRAVARTVA